MESSARVPGEPLTPAGGKEERPPAKKQKPPAKGKVEELADNLKDIYSIMDSLMGAAVTFSGRMYPDGLFCLADDVAVKLARNLLIVNDSVPKLGQKVTKVSAPILLLTTFLTDVAGKGLILYGILKSPKPGHGNIGASQG